MWFKCLKCILTCSLCLVKNMVYVSKCDSSVWNVYLHVHFVWWRTWCMSVNVRQVSEMYTYMFTLSGEEHGVCQQIWYKCLKCILTCSLCLVKNMVYVSKCDSYVWNVYVHVHFVWWRTWCMSVNMIQVSEMYTYMFTLSGEEHAVCQ